MANFLPKKSKHSELLSSWLLHGAPSSLPPLVISTQTFYVFFGTSHTSIAIIPLYRYSICCTSFLGALYPSESGLLLKHIVKRISSARWMVLLTLKRGAGTQRAIPEGSQETPSHPSPCTARPKAGEREDPVCEFRPL